MARIKVDTAALIQNKADIQKKINELESLNGQLDQLLASIEDSWQGKASEQYITTMRQHKKKAEQMIHVLNEFQGYIDQAASRFEQKDREGASRIRQC